MPGWDGEAAAPIPDGIVVAGGDEEAAIAVLRRIVAVLAPGAFEVRGADDIIAAADTAARCVAGLLCAPQPAAAPPPAVPSCASLLPSSLAPAAASDPQRAALRLLARMTALQLVVNGYAAAHFNPAGLTHAQAAALIEAEQLMHAALDTLLAVPGWDGSAAVPIDVHAALDTLLAVPGWDGSAAVPIDVDEELIPGPQPVVALLCRILVVIAPHESLDAADAMVVAAAAGLAARRVAATVEAAVTQHAD